MIESIWVTVAGPIPKQVTVPEGISVRPASVTILDTMPLSLAYCCNVLRVDSFSPFTTTFFCPSSNHFLKFEGSDFLDFRAQFTAACAT